MGDLRKFRHRLVADPLRRAVRRDQLRMLGLELLQPLQQPVVLPIADLRRRLDVILGVVTADLFAKLLDLGGDGVRHGSQPHPHAAAHGTDMPRSGCGIKQRNFNGPEPVLRNWCGSCGAT